MTRNDLYSLLIQAVRFHPEGEAGPWEQLQTFSVLQHMGSLNAESLGRSVLDRGKPFFWSRRWENLGYPSAIEFDFPAVFVIDRSAQFNSPFQQQGRSICPLHQIAVLYPNVENLEGTIAARCNFLHTEEIQQLTESMLVYLLEYIRSAIYASVDGADPAWYNQDYLDWYADENTVTYTMEALETHSFRKSMEAENGQLQISYHDDISAFKLCGVSADVRLCTPKCSSGYTPSFATPANCCYQT